MTDNPWLSQPDATPYPGMGYADPLAQRRIELLEAEHDELRAKVARVEEELAVGSSYRLGSRIREALDAPLPPSEPSSLPSGPGTPNDATGGAE